MYTSQIGIPQSVMIKKDVIHLQVSLRIQKIPCHFIYPKFRGPTLQRWILFGNYTITYLLSI